MNILITVTADSEKELDWRINELKKLLISQDIEICSCHFREEQAFLSALPIVSLEKKLFERSKRNILTTGAASCYPFTSFEMCDDNGILLGVNKFNSSLIIVDISWDWMGDVREFYHVGDRVLVRVNTISRENPETLSVTADIRSTTVSRMKEVIKSKATQKESHSELLLNIQYRACNFAISEGSL